MKFLVCCIPLVFFCAPVLVGQQASPPQINTPKIDEVTQAKIRYYSGVRDYILKYAETPASCSEIVESAISANEEECRKVLPLASGAEYLSFEQLEKSTDKLRETTRRWAMQVALEAKYPDPSVYKNLLTSSTPSKSPLVPTSKKKP